VPPGPASHSQDVSASHIAQTRVALDEYRAGPECLAYGELINFEPYSSVPWRYEGLATLEVDMLSPAMQERRVTSMTSVDNAAGTSTKDNCHGGAGWQAQAGGFTMIGLYQAFGPGAADGSFYYDTCGTTRK